jgi:hypothetical protein
MDAVTLPVEQTQIAGRGSARMVGKPEVIVRSGVLRLLPHSP